MIPRDQCQRWLFVCLLIGVAASCVNAPYRQFLLMQHVPTLLAVGLLGAVARRFSMSRFSFSCVVLFLAMHTLGARYLYSYTPYDKWAEVLCGVRISELFGWTRNHYDRVVHCSYGLLLVVPVHEFECRHLQISRRLGAVLAVECILATSAAYELLEWLVAVTFTPEWAESFLGQQGDIFDAQKDMALATGGAILAITLRMVVRRK
jgi:putative membrane protein